MSKKIIILGAGGCARELEWLICDINKEKIQFEFLGYVVSDLEKLTKRDSADKVIGDIAWLFSNQNKWDSLCIGIGDPQTRKRIVEKVKTTCSDANFPTLIHPSVMIDKRSATIEEGVTVAAGCVVSSNTHIHRYTMVSFNSVLTHECQIGEYCVINPSVNISGGVQIGNETLVGTGSQVLQYVRIGSMVQIGAGAVVTKNVSDNMTVTGVPAKPKV